MTGNEDEGVGAIYRRDGVNLRLWGTVRRIDAFTGEISQKMKGWHPLGRCVYGRNKSSPRFRSVREEWDEPNIEGHDPRGRERVTCVINMDGPLETIGWNPLGRYTCRSNDESNTMGDNQRGTYLWEEWEETETVK